MLWGRHVVRCGEVPCPVVILYLLRLRKIARGRHLVGVDYNGASQGRGDHRWAGCRLAMLGHGCWPVAPMRTADRCDADSGVGIMADRVGNDGVARSQSHDQ